MSNIREDAVFIVKLTLIAGAAAELIYFILWREFLWAIFGAVFTGAWLGWAIGGVIKEVRRKINKCASDEGSK